MFPAIGVGRQTLTRPYVGSTAVVIVSLERYRCTGLVRLTVCTVVSPMLYVWEVIGIVQDKGPCVFVMFGSTTFALALTGPA